MMNDLQQPPAALDAEKSVLSVLLNEYDQHREEHFEKLRTFKITKEHFYLPAHQMLFEVIFEHHSKGMPIEPVSLLSTLEKRDLLDKVGGPSILVEVGSAAPSAAYLEHHIRIIRDKFALRQLIAKANTVLEKAHSNPEDADDLLADTEASFCRIKEGLHRSDNYLDFQTLFRDWESSWEARLKGSETDSRIPSGFTRLDASINGGFRPGWSVVITGKTGGGKSAFAGSLAANFLRGGRNVLFVSAEMPSQEVFERLLSNLAQVSNGFIQSPPDGLSAQERGFQESIERVKADNSLGEFFVCEKPGKIEEIASLANSLDRKKGLDLIVLDYLQLLQPSETRNITRERQIAHISAEAKRMAIQLDCVVLALAQVNEDGHTRESKAIEHDADLWLSADKDEGIKIIKVRGSQKPKDAFRLTLDGDVMTFRESNKHQNHYS